MRRVNGGRFAGPENDPDRYELHECRGGGGEGEVWRAERRLDDGHVAEFAVKVGKQTDHATALRLAARWETQAVRLRSLSHTGLVRVQEAFFGASPHRASDASGAPTTPYFVMDWVEGEQLDVWAAAEPKASRRLAVLDNIASALDELHAAGFVHADVKPGNILVSQRTTAAGTVIPRAVLVDFGLMRSLTAAPPTQNMGTPGFVAQEALEGRYEPASDLYGLAATVFLLLTGTRPPFRSDVRGEVRRRLLSAGLEPRAADVIAGGFHPDAATRLGGSTSIVAWLAAVRGALSSMDGARLDFMPTQPVGMPRRGRRAALAAAAIGLVAATAAATNAFGNNDKGAGDRSADVASPAEISPQTTETSTTTTTAPMTTTTTTQRPTTTVTGPPERVYLAQQSRMQVEGSGGGKANIAGESYPWSFRSGLASCSGRDWTSVWEYTLGGDYTRLIAVAGVDDFSSADTVMRFRVLIDRREILNVEGRRNEAFRINEDVGGVNHVRFEVIATRDLCGTLSNKKDIGAFGDPIVT